MTKKASIPFQTSPEEYAEVARSQRKYAREVADKIEHGGELDSMAGGFTAAILRAWADNLSDVQKRPRGQAPRFDAGNVALEFAALVKGKGVAKDSALGIIAGRYGVSVEAIRKSLRKHGDAAMALLTFMQTIGQTNSPD